MTEQIYINGVLMDMKSGSPVSMVFQSPFFTDIDNIVSNRTNSVSFPVTKNNLAAIDNAHLSGSDSKFAYRKHKAIYYRDGIQIFSGLGTLLSITPTDIKFTFTWGNVSMFQKLLDYNLRDLKVRSGESDILIPWNDDAVKTNAYYASNVSYGLHRHPVLKVSTILDSIEAACGVSFENKDVFNQYRIPVLGLSADDDAKRLQGVIMGGNLYKDTRNYQYHHFLTVGTGDRDVRGICSSNGMFNVEGFDTVRIKFAAGFQYSVPAYSGVNSQSIRIYACTEDDTYRKQIASIPLTKSGSARFIYQIGSGLGEEKVLDLNVSDYSYLRIEVFVAGTSQSSATPTFTSCVVNIIPDIDKDQELIYGGVYPLFHNLPDWTVSQLLKNLMKMEGLFAVCPDDKTIRFVSVDALYDNRAMAIDVTNTLVLSNGLPSEKSFVFGSYARNNWFRYANDETVSTDASGKIAIDDDTLEESSDILTLDFAASDMDNGVVSIPLYTKNDNGEYEYEEVTPRILKTSAESSSSAQEVLTFQGLDWESLIASNYAMYASTIQNAKCIKASLLLSSLDLASLDLAVPLYSYEMGHYYAITKVTTKNDGMADVELLQLGVTKTADDAFTDDMELAVVPDGDGDYVATLTNRSLSQIGKINASGEYKVCLIRYGYARRGLFYTYTDRTGTKQTSKTARHANYIAAKNEAGYKNVRFEEGGGKTPCWRIIGYEKLYKGSIAAHSQVLKYYGGSTLVFGLLEKMTLPPMRKISKSKAGRIRNRASDGLSELSIALYRKNENGKWVIASNIVPVRSRTEAKDAYWDFDQSNIKYV